MKNIIKFNSLTIAILFVIVGAESVVAAPTYTNNGNPSTPSGYKTYWPNINIGSCTLTNIKYVTDSQAATDPDGGNGTGTFAIDINAGTECNLSVFLDPDNQLQNGIDSEGNVIKRAGSWDIVNGINPYITQRNGAIYGYLKQDGNTLVFDTTRANGAGIEIAVGGKLVTDENLKIIVNKQSDGAGGSTSTALIVNGEADIKGDLTVDKTRTPADQHDWSRAIRVNGGILKVKDNLTVSDSFWTTGVGTDKGHSEALELVNGATVRVGKSASITHNLNSSGVYLGASSLLEINEDFLLKMTQLPGHSAAFGIISDNSTINVKGNLSVDGDEHVLINQSNNAVLSVDGKTTLTKTKSGNYIQNNNSSIIFNNSLIDFVSTSTGGNGLVNTNSGKIYFNKDGTQLNAANLANAISNDNNGEVHFEGKTSTVGLCCTKI